MNPCVWVVVVQHLLHLLDLQQLRRQQVVRLLQSDLLQRAVEQLWEHTHSISNLLKQERIRARLVGHLATCTGTTTNVRRILPKKG